MTLPSYALVGAVNSDNTLGPIDNGGCNVLSLSADASSATPLLVVSASRPPPTLQPYTRVVLSEGCSDAMWSVPSLLQPYISSNDWRAFWSSLEPVHAKVKRFDNGVAGAVFFLYVLGLQAFYWPIIYGSDVDGAGWYSVLIWSVLHGLVTAWKRDAARSRYIQLDQIRAVCRAEQERLFRTPNNGRERQQFVIECAFEYWPKDELREAQKMSDLVSGFAIYFRPVSQQELLGGSTLRDGIFRDGYLRIRVHSTHRSGVPRDPQTWHDLEGWRTLPMEALFQSSSFESIGNRHHELAQALWTTRFWPAMMQRSLNYTAASEAQTPLLQMFIACLVGASVGMGAHVDQMLYLALVCVFGMFLSLVFLYRATCRYKAAKRQRADWVRDFVDEFSALGLYIELRGVYEFDKYQGWVGRSTMSLSSVDYLYVFPIEPVRDNPHDQAENGKGVLSGHGGLKT